MTAHPISEVRGKDPHDAKPTPRTNPILEFAGVEAGYGNTQVLFGLSMAVRPSEVVSILGRNGVGKTTSLLAALGLATVTQGSIRFRDTELVGRPTHQVARLGLGLVPEGRRIFPNLTVREQLLVAARASTRQETVWSLDNIVALFPRLGERLNHMGTQLSGGEQQMLAIGRTLSTHPTLLVLDEATEGLAPLVRRSIWNALRVLKENGLAILVIDKDLEAQREVADRHYIIEKGRVVWEGAPSAMAEREDLKHRYLGI